MATVQTNGDIASTSQINNWIHSQGGSARLRHLKRKMANLPPELLMLLMEIIKDGDVDAQDSGRVDRLRKECCKRGIDFGKESDLAFLAQELHAYAQGWDLSEDNVNFLLEQLGLQDVTAAEDSKASTQQLQAMITNALKDGALRQEEIRKINDAFDPERRSALIPASSEEEVATLMGGIDEAEELLRAGGDQFMSSLSTEGLKRLQKFASKGHFSVGDAMLLLMLLVLGIMQKRLQGMSQALVDKQVAAGEAQQRYQDHLAGAPTDKKSDAYKDWMNQKEDLKMQMDDADDEVQQMVAELKRLTDKYDMLQQMFQGLITKFGQMESRAAQAVGQ